MTAKQKLVQELQQEALRPIGPTAQTANVRSLDERLSRLEDTVRNLREEVADLQRQNRHIDAVNRGEAPALKIA